LEPLIFDRLDLTWKAILPRAMFHAYRNHAGITPLSTFAGPGNAFQKSVDGVREERSGLVFPDWGQWRLMGGFGALKLLLIDPSMPRDEIPREVLGFVSANTWHSRIDHHLAHRDGDRRFFRFDRLAEKFFYSDQPLGLFCGYAARFLAILLDELGFETRLCRMVDGDRSGAHNFPEVRLPECGRWAIVDPDFGVMVQRRGRWLGGVELSKLVSNGQQDEVEVVDVARKSITRLDVKIAPGAFAQVTWPAELMDKDHSCADSYRTNFLSRQFKPAGYSRIDVFKDIQRSIDQTSGHFTNED